MILSLILPALAQPVSPSQLLASIKNILQSPALRLVALQLQHSSSQLGLAPLALLQLSLQNHQLHWRCSVWPIHFTLLNRCFLILFRGSNGVFLLDGIEILFLGCRMSFVDRAIIGRNCQSDSTFALGSNPRFLCRCVQLLLIDCLPLSSIHLGRRYWLQLVPGGLYLQILIGHSVAIFVAWFVIVIDAGSEQLGVGGHVAITDSITFLGLSFQASELILNILQFELNVVEGGPLRLLILQVAELLI